MEKILVFIVLQFVVFTPFFIIWIYDCKNIGKENLSISLKERFIAWLLFCPIWALGFFSSKIY